MNTDLAVAQREKTEAKRLAELSAAEEKYKQECEKREAGASAHNAEVTKLINDLAFDVESAIEEYVGIVLSNSVYPEGWTPPPGWKPAPAWPTPPPGWHLFVPTDESESDNDVNESATASTAEAPTGPAQGTPETSPQQTFAPDCTTVSRSRPRTAVGPYRRSRSRAYKYTKRHRRDRSQ
ncbi:hypothetical protein [Streptomyces sp. NPDC058457]|uniref:hypothetical protein n=1 Tax=Streptomyces sp. NPDC058457 TaxID=3346507 RepID=UPI0036591B43